MKRIIASASLLALGISGTQAAGMVASLPANKPWSISASLRGFYDDNPALLNESFKPQDSFGFDVSPSIGVNLNSGQTTFNAGYAYTFRYYDNRPQPGSTDNSSVDHVHVFNMALMHAFTERFSIDMHDQFVISQEPTLVSPAGTPFVSPSGSASYNDGGVNFHIQATRLLEIVLGYQNLFFDYDNPVSSVILDRMEHTGKVDFRWQVTPQTVAVLGYQYKVVDYLKDAIPPFVNPSFPFGFDPSQNNNRAHIVTVGLDHNFNPSLFGSFRVGGQWTDYYNNPTAGDELSPYADASLRYTYRPNSFVQTGFKYARSQTDASAIDAATTYLYATLHHGFTPQFAGELTGGMQNSDYNGGAADSLSDWIYYLDFNLAYHFTPNFAATMDYKYDLVDSDIANRGYQRNRVFLGVTASY